MAPCSRCAGTRAARGCTKAMDAACCRLTGGCRFHVIRRAAGRPAAAAAAAAAAAEAAASGPAAPADAPAPAAVNDPPPQPPADAFAPAAPPAWLQTILQTQQAQFAAQLQATVQAFTQAMQAQQPAAPAAAAVAAPVQLPPLPPANLLPPPPGVFQLRGAASQPAAHLQAFGALHEVGPHPHIHNQFNDQVNINNGPSAVSHFLNGLTGGLAPLTPGQQLPSLEQILSRGTRNHKPYSSDAEFIDALDGMMESSTGQLADSSGESDTLAIRSLLKHIQQTRDYIGTYGHKLSWEYHTRVVKAMRNRPPIYDPARDGPSYTQAFMEVFILPDVHSKKAPYKRTAAKQQATSQDSAPSGAKRARLADVCSIHPHGTHSNAECRSQSKPADASGRGK